jgi:transcriptional regulator with XRE-family HTH domain
MDLPTRLRILRAERGLTIGDAAERIGIGRDSLSYLEKGEHQPRDTTLARIARAYDVPLESLMTADPLVAGKAEAAGREGARRHFVTGERGMISWEVGKARPKRRKKRRR